MTLDQIFHLRKIKAYSNEKRTSTRIDSCLRFLSGFIDSYYRNNLSSKEFIENISDVLNRTEPRVWSGPTGTLTMSRLLSNWSVTKDKKTLELTISDVDNIMKLTFPKEVFRNKAILPINYMGNHRDPGYLTPWS